MKTPFYIDDLAALRGKLDQAARAGSRLGQVWEMVRRLARAHPDGYPWYVPFVALVTGEERDLEPARRAVRNYVRTLDVVPFGMGLQFHFWCFAFPHARWALYFQWLDSIGAWDAAEAKALREKLITFQFENFFYGMRTKPEPECVDNQTMALCFSNALVGHLFSGAPAPSITAARMKEDGLRRLPDMLGGMPPSGYSGEGSTYMDYVVGPCIPFLVEFLQRVEGGDWYRRELPPHGGSAATVLQMIAREWMPNGLLLPWDHYGYSLPVRSSIAYAARRTGEAFYTELLERHASWVHNVSIGWGFDDLVWALVWWPETVPQAAVGAGSVFTSWAHAEIGGALVSADTDLYLMQMWDHTNPGYPTRAHVNPNAVVLAAYGSPLTVDGVPAKECTAFHYADTWKELTNVTFSVLRSNFGPGCAGSHSVLLVDGWEGMRATTEYEQATQLEFDPVRQVLAADVTPLYRERWPDALAVRRRSQLIADRFWLIDDLAEFAQEHEFTSRWYFRPDLVDDGRGVTIETAEGVRLQFFPVLGPDAKRVQTIAGYPDRLDGAAVQVDFHQRGTACRWLWLAWPERTRRDVTDLADAWDCAPDPDQVLDLATAAKALDQSALRLPLTLPAFVLADQPVVRRWWYRRRVRVPAGPELWLRLPRQMLDPKLWLNGREIDLAPYALRMNLLEPQVRIPQELLARGELEIVVRTDCGTGQYGAENREGSGFSGQPAIVGPADPAPPVTTAWRKHELVVSAGTTRWKVPVESPTALSSR